MKGGTLSYNGTTYLLTASEIEDLLARGVIVPDLITAHAFELAADHVIEEIGADPVIVDHRTGAEARGEGDEKTRQRMLAVRYQHRDGEGGR
jgi:hypothetical protein